MKYTNNLFESIKEALNKKTTSDNAGYRDFMKLEIGNTYVVRLIPNLENPERTLFHYFHHIWKSVITNQLVSVLCPNTYGEGCPIDEYRSKVYNTKNQAEIDRIKPLKRNESWLCNVYVVKDPTNPDNQGQIKVLRFGKQLFKIISEAISGDDAEEFGSKIFDLSEKGCSLRIKVEANEGGYPAYTASKFMSPSALEGVDNVEEIYSSAKDLDGVFEHKTRDEIAKMLKVHFLGEEVSESTTTASYDEEEEYVAPVVNKTSSVSSEKEELAEAQAQDDRIQDILKDL
ncbi:MAG: hypothetical protein EBU90_00710 [Proteobacteria bacterium]|nr:hypothetical protein [Pseudomonadota bacterium]NBP12953.1 hypothetical protein [bacterium]